MGIQSPGSIAEQSRQGDPVSARSIGAVVQTCPDVTLEIGVFFDGTLNNAANVAAGPTGGDSDSYTNDFSNVAKLQTLYYDKYNDVRSSCGGYATRYYGLYVPGAGTTSGEDDSFWGYSIGMGKTGVENAVYGACVEVGNIIRDLSSGVEPKEIILDVFGFSRGAAAARYFVNCFNQGFVEYDTIGPGAKRASLPEGRNITIRFLGIFDTVAAIGYAKNTNNGDVNVHLNSASAQKIMHLTAADEFRGNFRLNENVPAGGTHKVFPGAHSDVGGGYKSGEEEVVIAHPRSYIDYTREGAEAQSELRYAEAVQNPPPAVAKLIREGWADHTVVHATPVKIFVLPGRGGMSAQRTYDFKIEYRLERTVDNGLARIPLHYMHQEAKSGGVPLNPVPSGPDYDIPPDLSAAKAILMGGSALDPATHRNLRHKYVHHSSVYGDIAHGPDRNSTRVEYDNHSEKAK